MLRRFPLLIATVIPFLILCGCGDAQIRPLAQDKVLLNVSLAEKVRLLTRLGFTNMGPHGPVERDSLGTRLFIHVEPDSFVGRAQTERTQQLVVVTAQGSQIVPWHFPANERVTQIVMPQWARVTLDLDPDSGLVVINDNSRFWGRSWLFDLNAWKRKSISTSDWTLIVKKELAQKWVALTKP